MTNKYIIDSLTYGDDSYSFSTPYGTCSTKAAETAKVVDCANFLVLESGARVAVKFTDANEASAPTLNVNNTGAIDISCTGFALTNAWKSNSIIEFVYDGTNWCIVGYLPDDVLTESSLTDAIDDALAKAKTSGAFDGEAGVGVQSAEINTAGKLVITLTDGTSSTLGDVVGSDGETPQLKIDSDNYWEVSYDNGKTWTSMGVKATGAAGSQITLKNNVWYIDGTSTNVKAKGEDYVLNDSDKQDIAQLINTEGYLSSAITAALNNIFEYDEATYTLNITTEE